MPASKIVYDRNEILTVVEKRQERAECRPGRRGLLAVNGEHRPPGAGPARVHRQRPAPARNDTDLVLTRPEIKIINLLPAGVFIKRRAAPRASRLRARTRGQSACLSSPGIPFGASFSILALERVQPLLMAPDGRGDKNAEFAVIGERHIVAERRLIACRISVRAVFFRWKTELLVPNGGLQISCLR